MYNYVPQKFEYYKRVCNFFEEKRSPADERRKQITAKGRKTTASLASFETRFVRGRTDSI